MVWLFLFNCTEYMQNKSSESSEWDSISSGIVSMSRRSCLIVSVSLDSETSALSTSRC